MFYNSLLTVSAVSDNYYMPIKMIPNETGEAVRKHGLTIPNGIVHTINEPGSVGKHKIRATTWLHSLRVQFPSEQPIFGSGDNVLYFWENVNIVLPRNNKYQ